MNEGFRIYPPIGWSLLRLHSPQSSTPTVALNRSLLRNVYFHDATNPDVILGGFFQNGSVTEANFLDILGILLVLEGNPLRVQERVSDHIVSRTDIPLKKGVYDIYCDASIQVNNEPWIPRLISHNTSGRDDGFCHKVRNRDRRCVISGLINPEGHIQANIWDIDDTLGIDSCQNGFLLDTAIHTKFDQYLISVNPDDNYKIVVFDMDIRGLDGRILDPVCRNPDDPHRVSDQLLRLHFRQSILANVRGAGEPIFEHDFPQGHDMMGEILAGPYGQERFELEIASRLRGFPKDNRFHHREALQLSA
ncbi:hypothetical protein B9Z19DRAFT_1195653 [Tuber borchii]|uniref:Uncharacterized protein n=1 Tax=Tuber borchii TaxID=42251 RepID=A0A2T6ZI84_TUBBO|nr:hypothetical protein B9Z19DRAFT_1195653 [Tuber borchii]